MIPSEYMRLMGRLWALYRAGQVPRQDFQKLTQSEAYMFDRTGTALPATVLELQQYLESIEEVTA